MDKTECILQFSQNTEIRRKNFQLKIWEQKNISLWYLANFNGAVSGASPQAVSSVDGGSRQGLSQGHSEQQHISHGHFEQSWKSVW
jgi:hypothetical protein